MRPIAVFYHAYFGGGEVPVTTENALRITALQLDHMNYSGLSQAADYFQVGVTGTDLDLLTVAAMCPDKAEVIHNTEGVAELPTLKRLQFWCKGNPEALVLYLHTKGVIHGNSPVYEAWRNCMQNVVVGKWHECVDHLQGGKESVGAHWLTPERYAFLGPWSYWGGNFWWATAKFINTLPPIDVNSNRYEAEVWIGRGPKRPRVKDYAPHFPMSGC